MPDPVGLHQLIEMYDCDVQKLNSPEVIEAAMVATALSCGTTILHRYFHRFAPQGVTGILVIAESHMSIHTWPERRYAGVDLFTCGQRILPEEGLEQLREALGCARLSHQTVPRGVEAAAESTPGDSGSAAGRPEPV